MYMKKRISVSLAAVMALSVVACSKKPAVSFEEVKQMAEKEIPAIGLMLDDNWDENTLPRFPFSLFANAQYLHYRDNGEGLPKVDVGENRYLASKGIKLDVLIPAITKYYPFSEKLLRESFENSLLYDPRTDAVVLADGWGWHLTAVMQDVADNHNGTYDISYGMYTTENTLEYIGVVRARIHNDGHMQFLSNTINKRYYDYFDTETVCKRLLPIFAIPSVISWDKDNSREFLEIVGSSPFKQIVERLYEIDTGKTFDNSDGYTAVDNYVTYGAKYFDFDVDDIRSVLENSYAYNAANDTVLMSDGLGSTTGLKFTQLEQAGDIYTISYEIVYVEDRPDAGEMTFKINEDGSYKFLSGKFIEK